ncbi:MAG TPA: AMP-binding protein [Streptosporangiaceae bacterium]
MTEQARPAQKNYVRQVLELFERYGDAGAIVAWDGRRSYADIRRTALRLARILHDQGVRAGAGVAMLAIDTIDSAALHLALHLIGCRTIWIATYAPVREQVDFAVFAQPDVLIYTVTERRERIAGELASLTGPLKIFSLGAGGQGMDLFAALKDDPGEFDLELAGPDPESLFYTSGTTGKPKLVCHGGSYYAALLDIAEYYRMIGEPPMRFLVGASFTYVSGQTPAFLTLFEGGTLFIDEGADPVQTLATIEKERITSTFLTPAQLYELIDQARTTPTDTSSMRYLNVGGAAASPARLAEAIECFGPAVRIVYGSSEVPLITDYPFLDRDPDHPERLSSCGRPFADTLVGIRDASGAAVPPGQTGEVWVSGSLLMTGYWRQPELTGQTIVDGWLRTGDVGHLDEDGYLFLVGRASDMIITGQGAANVYPQPIEDVLVSHPAVRAAAVIAVPHEEYGEAVHAVVVIAPGADVTADELRELVRGELNDLYAPGTVEFAGSLPMTPLSKVDKRLLRERHHGGAAEPSGSAS